MLLHEKDTMRGQGTSNWSPRLGPPESKQKDAAPAILRTTPKLVESNPNLAALEMK